ncbi:unnamed protein product [Bemisia tabaci]|uniref:Phosphatidylethanolamine-binding protein n=1 Tax=Bemisia tabaci TaxID=7038 RepID=A0A9P0F8W5_BEMTA|nr:unnamed protein product [Bemisia tabaci]
MNIMPRFIISLRYTATVLFQLVFLFVLLHISFAIVKKPPKEIKKKMEEHKILPDIVDHPAKYELKLKYFYEHIPNFGNDLNPHDLDAPPYYVNFERRLDVDEYYTMLMIDPDQPSRAQPEEREWIHWLVTNMWGCSLLSGDTIVRYLTPKPEQGTGPHRYIFFVFRQADGEMNFDEKIINNTRYDGDLRGHFNTKEFIKRNRLGAPHAVNFFYSEWQPPPASTALPFTVVVDVEDVEYQELWIPEMNRTSPSDDSRKYEATTNTHTEDA